MEKEEIRLLIEDFAAGHISDENRNRLLWLIENKELLVTEVMMEMKGNEQVSATHDDGRMKEILQGVLQTDSVKRMAPVTSLVARSRRRWIWAAASVVIILGIAAAFYSLSRNDRKVQVVVNSQKGIQAPGNNRAMITLADGRKVFLDSLHEGEVADQGNIKVVKLANGRIAYQNSNDEEIQDVKFNTLTNPRGSRVIDIELADGTHVWLNAGSSITYPVAFVEKERAVKLIGEGYFEVAQNKEQPFIVNAGEMKIRVLGTHFNVNAYQDEADIKATLLEGKVDVSSFGKTVVLEPGQQADLRVEPSNNTPAKSGFILKTIDNIDIDQVMAWKNGFFALQDASLKEVMLQISRWYDVEVVYEGKIEPRKFGGGIARDAPLNDILKILRESNVNFKVEGRKIIVTP